MVALFLKRLVSLLAVLAFGRTAFLPHPIVHKHRPAMNHTGEPGGIFLSLSVESLDNMLSMLPIVASEMGNNKTYEINYK